MDENRESLAPRAVGSGPSASSSSLLGVSTLALFVGLGLVLVQENLGEKEGERERDFSPSTVSPGATHLTLASPGKV